jgi:hypothetical protein
MKKSSLLIAIFALAMSAFASSGGHAASPCDSKTKPNDPRTAQDPFGSCEKSNGNVVCGADATSVGGVFHLDTTASGGQGVEGCAGGNDTLPVHGRLGAFASSTNDVTVFVDGDDAANTTGAGGWDRLDVKPSKQEVCFRRGSGGTYWTKGGGTSNPDSVNASLDSGGPHQGGPCK